MLEAAKATVLSLLEPLPETQPSRQIPLYLTPRVFLYPLPPLDYSLRPFVRTQLLLLEYHHITNCTITLLPMK